MRQRLTAALFLALAVSVFAAVYQQLVINEFGGLDTDTSSAVMTQKNTPDAENVITDLGGLQPREGFSSLSTTTCQGGLWSFPHSNGTRYVICHDTSVNTLKASSDGGQNFTTVVSTVAASLNTAVAPVGDTLYFVNTTDGLKSWNTSSITVASSTLKASQLVTHKGCLWAAVITGSPRTILKSAAVTSSSAPSWQLITDPAVTDPASFFIAGGLDEPLTGLYASHLGRLMWFKSNAFGAITGDDRSNFEQKTYSDQVGTSYHESVRDCDGMLRWLGPRRTVYEWNGAQLTDLTDLPTGGVKTLFETVVQGDANSRSWTQTSQSDWQAGTIGSGLSATTSAGDVQFSTGTMIDAFSDGDFTSSPSWTEFDDDGGSVLAGTSELVFADDSSGNGTGVWKLNEASTGSWAFQYKCTTTATSRLLFKLCQSTPTTNAAEANCYQLAVTANGAGAGSSSVLISSGSAETVLLQASNDESINNSSSHEIKLDRQSSGAFNVYIDGVHGGGSTHASAPNLGYVSFSMHSNTAYSSGTASVDGYMFFYTTVSFQSQSFNIGTNISAWGTFTAGATSNGGSLAYVVYTDTNSSLTTIDAGTFTSSQTITNGSQITIATSAYVAVGSTFTRTASTQTPTLSDFTILWSEGSTLEVPSVWSKGRWWLGVAISSTGNNIVLPLDRNRQWQKWRGINATSMAMHNASILFSNANGTFQAESGYTDDGTAIASYYKTPDFSPGGPNVYSTFDALFLTTDRSDATLTTTYQVNGINTDYSFNGTMAMNSTAGIQNKKLPFPLDGVEQGKQINFKFSVTGSSFWRLLGGTLDYKPDPVAP